MVRYLKLHGRVPSPRFSLEFAACMHALPKWRFGGLQTAFYTPDSYKLAIRGRVQAGTGAAKKVPARTTGTGTS